MAGGGYYYDEETSWYCLSSRYYDPEVGRFINADDVSYLGADGSPLSYNLFAYCKNNPINMIDADGHAAIHILLATIFGIAGREFGDFIAKQLGYSSGWKYWAIRSGVTIGGAILGGVCANLLTKAVAVYLQSHSSVLVQLVKKWGVSKFCSVMNFLGVNPFLVSMDNSKFIAFVRLFNDKAITLTYQWAVSLYNKAISLGYQIMFDEPHGGYQWHIHFIGSKGKLGNLHVQIPKTAWDYLSKLLD